MLTGHQKQWQYLQRLAGLDRLPHALLFSGESRVDKRALALEFVSSVFGEDITKRPHPDFFFVAPVKITDSHLAAKEIQISQIRDCLGRLSLKPSLASFKVAIIDQAHCLNQEAQSALLKTLEEPKGKTLLILITEYPEMLFPTVLSRVQRIKFYPEKKEKAENEKLWPEIAGLVRSDLATRFQYVEKIHKSPELKEILNAWLHYFRQRLISSLNSKLDSATPKKLASTLQRIQSTYYLLFKTNINSRLALENLMLEL